MSAERLFFSNLAALLLAGASLTLSCAAEVVPGGKRSVDADQGDEQASDDDEDEPDRTFPDEGGESPLRRLTRTEFNKTVADLLGDRTAPADAFITDDFASSFDNSAERFSVSSTFVSQLLTTAEDIAARSDPNRLFSCDISTLGDRTCAEQWITTVGRRALRRPLDSAEVADHLALYDERRAADDGHSDALRAVLIRWLLSPEFLHHVEIGDGTGALTSYEVASRLSYLLWESLPDEALLDAAAADVLRDTEVVRTQAERMLADARARDAMWHFHQQWFDLWKLRETFKSPERHPAWTEQVQSVEEETRRFVEHVVFGLRGGLRELLTSRFTFMNSRVGELYGVNVPGASDPAGGAVLFRVNVGGPALSSTDGGPGWSEDTSGSASSLRLGGGTNFDSTGNTISLHSSVPSGTPSQLFQTQRWDDGSSPEMRWELPVSAAGPVEVRLFFAEIWTGITGSGQRVFDVQVEGAVPPELDDIDPRGLSGELYRGIMRSAVVTVTDGRLNIELVHGVEEPMLAGIEVRTVDAFQQVSLEDTDRAGLLTQPSFLAVHGKAARSSPILRGVFVEDRLLCAPPAPPPPGVSAGAVDAVEGGTTRQYTEQLTSPSECQGCHASINGIGFGLESFDEVGSFRVTENGVPVNVAGELMFSDAAGVFSGARGLTDRLAASEDVAECMARQWFRFAHGRTEVGADGRIIGEMMERATAQDGSVIDLVIAITQVETFYRVHATVADGG